MPYMNGINYEFDPVEGYSRPTLYPGTRATDWSLPEEITNDFHRLNSILEGKYSREYLKVCAFYNKMFPTLKASDWIVNSYNVQPFTYMDQERTDTGTGISMNFLKEIVDQLTSRLGTIQFVPYLSSEEQSFEYVLYRDEVERILRMYISKDKFNKKCIQAFHDSAVVGYSHVFIDPYTGKMVKANDWEIGMFESQMNKGHVMQMLYRDYAFPVCDALVYLESCDEKQKEELLESMSGKVTVDLCMYFDCMTKTCYVTIDGKALPDKEYPFDEVLMATMTWDTGFSAVTTSSLFDLLYPLQREINKMNAKEQQLIRMYKGSVPVFSADVELAMKSITNGSGECMYVDTQRPIDSLMTVIQPTPLDPELGAKVTEYKTAMYELAGIQQATFNMENMRSAAAVVAFDQMRDSVFQAQLTGMSDFISCALQLYIKYNAAYKPNADKLDRVVDWDAVNDLLQSSYINLKPVHMNDPLSDEEKTREAPVDYIQLATSRVVLGIIKGDITFDTMPYYIDNRQVTLLVAATLVKFEALGIDVPDCLHEYLITAFIEAVRDGEIDL